MPSTVRLGFTGDVMLGRQVDRVQRTRPVEAVWDDVVGRLQGLDGLFVNLECCLSTRGSQWTRTYRPFHFRADPEWAIPALESAGVDYCSLANNHVLDYGDVALEDTLDALSGAGITHAGAGRTAAEAREPTVVSPVGPATNGSNLTVAVVSFTDNTPEFAAGEDSPGTARVEFDLDDRESREIVADALDVARAHDPDLLVASLHWGPNMRTEPPQTFRAFGRWLVERGVDLVHGHSAHVFQGIEVHAGRPICYDAGDFVDDYRVDADLRNDRSFLFELLVEDGEPRALSLHPVEIANYAVHEARPTVAEWCRETMRSRSAAFETTFERDGEALVVDLGT